MPRWNCADLFKDAGEYGGDKLHRTLTNYIAAQQQLYESSTLTYKLDHNDALASWNTMPENVKDITGDIYYGLGSLASFHRRDDLPMIQEIAT